MASASDRFVVDVRRFVEKAKGNATLVVRKVALDVFSRVVLRSPVDTGRFRGNWQCSVGSIDRTVTQQLDPTGQNSVNRVKATASSLVPGTVAYLANSLPYARRLEYGWSRQAPSGMVRVTAREYQASVRRAVGEVS